MFATAFTTLSFSTVIIAGILLSTAGERALLLSLPIGCRA
jgi:hypothetical protein